MESSESLKPNRSGQESVILELICRTPEAARAAVAMWAYWRRQLTKPRGLPAGRRGQTQMPPSIRCLDLATQNRKGHSFPHMSRERHHPPRDQCSHNRKGNAKRQMPALIGEIEGGWQLDEADLRWLAAGAVDYRNPGESADAQDACKAIEVATRFREKIRTVMHLA